MEVIKQFYCVKNALSNGDKIPLLELKVGKNGEYAYEDYAYTGGRIQYRIGRDCFEDKTDAVNAAVKMRDRRIASLHKQIEKLENLQFSTW